MPLRLAELAAGRRDFVTARRHYEAALKMEPTNPVLLNNLAWVAGRLGEPDAVTIAERALKLAPQSGVIEFTVYIGERYRVVASASNARGTFAATSADFDMTEKTTGVRLVLQPEGR